MKRKPIPDRQELMRRLSVALAAIHAADGKRYPASWLERQTAAASRVRDGILYQFVLQYEALAARKQRRQ